MRNLRTAIAAAILAALTLAAAHSTVANGPPQPVEPQEFELPAGQACDFGLRVSQSGGNLHIKEFRDRNGVLVRTIQAGKGFLLTYTNLKAGTSVTSGLTGRSRRPRTTRTGHRRSARPATTG